MNNVIGRVVSCFWLTSGTERITKAPKITNIKNLPYAQNLLKPLAVLTLGKDNPFSKSVKLNAQTDG